uniref:brain-specific angiogenesis inhibitor 1-associated protein 2-like isoform X2 n=1 Tax=Styela clava TaxID=7725 RepID=UPI001939E481|nr:brain-specific angiogenesis inhibitor 1-associated protein 2-like isoform X2 [Styela clava]
MSFSPEEIHKKTENIHKTISEQYNPTLKNFLLAGRQYEKALSNVSIASRQYFDTMAKLGSVASDNESSKDLCESTRQISDTLRQTQLNFDETVKFLSTEVIYPLENKLENDMKYMQNLQKKYLNDYRLRTEDLQRITQTHRKMKQKSFNGKKSYKYDEKEKELAETVAHKQRSFEQFQHDHLKNAFIEERRRYCFFVEQNCELTKKKIMYHRKALESLTSQLPKWVESCADAKILPDQADLLLGNVKSDDNNSIYSIPEPPSEPAAQYNGGYGNVMPGRMNPTMNSHLQDGYNAPLPQPVNSTGHNVIPRENRKRVVAVFSHSVPGNPTQLGFEKGDEIILMIPMPRDGWHYGENDRTKQRGWFPFSYTRLKEQPSALEKPQEPVVGHMPLPPADYNEPSVQQNGNGWPAPPQDHGAPDSYRQMKDQMLSGRPPAGRQRGYNNNTGYSY